MKEILQRLKDDFVPVLGCTNPIAVAYAANACQILNELPSSI